jgi:hypothetical protein
VIAVIWRPVEIRFPNIPHPRSSPLIRGKRGFLIFPITAITLRSRAITAILPL